MKTPRSASLRRALVVVLLTLLAVPMHARADDLGPFCNPLQPPSRVSGQGTRAQLSLHYNAWIPAYVARCAKAVGAVSYFGTNDSFAARAMALRENFFYGRDTPLSVADQTLIEGDLDPTVSQRRVAQIQHIPVYTTAVSVVYNLADCPGPQLKLSGEILSLVYAGAITRWNDPLLVRDNAWLSSCNRAVLLAVRVDESGSTAVFKDYLAKRNPVWRPYTASQLNTSWPPLSNIACQADGETAVAGCVGSRRGAIGYVAMNESAGLTQASVDNGSRTFAGPSLAGCSAAAASSTLPPATTGDWSNVSLTNPSTGYALCSFSYFMAWVHYGEAYKPINVNLQQVRNIRDYVDVILSGPAQAQLGSYGYGALPASVLALARSSIGLIAYP